MARQVFSKGVGNQGDVGRVASQPGSREPDPQAVPALSGFDPSRAANYRLDAALRMAEEICERLRGQIITTAAEISHDAETSLLARYLSGRTRDLHDWAVHLSAWGQIADAIRRDSDGSGEAGETALAGSTEGDSAGPKDIAQTPEAQS